MDAALRAVAAKAGSRKLLLAVAAAATAAANHQWAAVASIVIAYVLAEAHVDASSAKAAGVVDAAATAVALAAASGRNPELRPEAAGMPATVNTAKVTGATPVTVHPNGAGTIAIQADVPFTVTAPHTPAAP